MNKKFWWMAGAGLAGLIAAFWQLLDKLQLLKHPGSVLSCNLNATFNCTKVLTSHQYEVFGFPNAMVGIVMFTFFLTVAIMVLGSKGVKRKLMLVVQGLALFMLGFILWFVFESTFRIQAICLFCTVIGTAVVTINAVMLRENFGQKMGRWASSGADLFGWALLWLIVVGTVAIKLG